MSLSIEHVARLAVVAFLAQMLCICGPLAGVAAADSSAPAVTRCCASSDAPVSPAGDGDCPDRDGCDCDQAASEATVARTAVQLSDSPMPFLLLRPPAHFVAVAEITTQSLPAMVVRDPGVSTLTLYCALRL
ncbi:MAG: hypothetical protein R3336_05860 [Phycisphaeraceae bacterium]|nr:hypothetical protein [Phycisphaeraceae bacterium]